jgi:hypothetical protein
MLSAQYNSSVHEAQIKLESFPPKQHIIQNTGTQNKIYISLTSMTFILKCLYDVYLPTR